MGHKNSKPEPPPQPPPPSQPWLPGNCPTLFECHPNSKRSEVIKHALVKAYKHNPGAARCLMCLLFLMVVVGIGITGWRVLSKRQARRKRMQAARVEAEKGGTDGFADDI
ncbi:hypothetical protein P171DRAFT_484970 [Karstenula rhodostoma CBS 690.94]|uniref:Uncharacterized protein n=1 Tax=Karstenula rhodostoma CBS 690.94 TaxID=1392251 RepID=A0A9P4PIW9_9PLEO|nr:hypothetical protein P171DRAFT_484970 [Karstenula rhodostoma CBS 690.94]